MKMRLYILVLILSVSTLSFSQGFKGGMYAGLVASQVDGDMSEGYNKIGFQVGAYSRYLLNDKLSIDPELRFIQKGSKHSDDKNNLFFTIQLNYLELPVLLSYQLNDRLALGGGLSLGYLLKAHVDDPFGAVPQDYLVYKKTDVNFVGKVKFNISEHLWSDLKFAYSILHITTESPRQFNNLFAFSLGYEF